MLSSPAPFSSTQNDWCAATCGRCGGSKEAPADLGQTSTQSAPGVCSDVTPSGRSQPLAASPSAAGARGAPAGHTALHHRAHSAPAPRSCCCRWLPLCRAKLLGQGEAGEWWRGRVGLRTRPHAGGADDHVSTRARHTAPRIPEAAAPPPPPPPPTLCCSAWRSGWWRTTGVLKRAGAAARRPAPPSQSRSPCRSRRLPSRLRRGVHPSPLAQPIGPAGRPSSRRCLPLCQRCPRSGSSSGMSL
jgi:hypothetical protein